jgi:hypothetical protein
MLLSLCDFMSITSLREAVSLVVDIDVEEDGEEEKWTVICAGACPSSVRVMVMGRAGLWYFRRTRWVFQNFLRGRRIGVSYSFCNYFAVFLLFVSSSASSLGHSLCAIMPMLDLRRKVHVDARHLRWEHCSTGTISYRE